MSASICLNMIVKDEAHVIRRCLDAVRPFIDHWVIVDTGSTDGTQAIIREHLADVPGELHERPWRDFGHNRSEAMDLARGKAEYILVMDADNVFCAPADWRWPELAADGYDIVHRSGSTAYGQCVLVCSRLRWRYVGVLHEYITADEPHRRDTLASVWIDRRHEGARSRDPETFRRDAAILDAALRDEPGNARYAFYLAQSWRDAQEPGKALEAYRHRAAMPGWDEETWYSLYEIARLTTQLGASPAEVQAAYLAAHRFRPQRAEPMVQLARWHRARSEWAQAREYARKAQAIPRPNDSLFVDEDVYRFAADYEVAVAAYAFGDFLECFALCWKLLDGDCVPERHRAGVEANLALCADAAAAASAGYPAAIARRLAMRSQPSKAAPGVTLSMTLHGRSDHFERTLNSFLNCCTDVDSIERFVCVGGEDSPEARTRLQERYPFIEFVGRRAGVSGPAGDMNRMLDLIATRYWLHLDGDWNFIATMDYVARAVAIFEREPSVAQVMFNRNYAESVEDRRTVGGTLRRLPGSATRYLVHEYLPAGPAREARIKDLPPGVLSSVAWPHFSTLPSLMRVDALRDVGRMQENSRMFEQDFAERFMRAGFESAYFDAIASIRFG